MTNINLDLAAKLDGSESRMIAIFVDSWGDKLVVPLNYNKTIDPEEFFTPCAHCGNAVLDCNFENGSDCCDRCNEGHKSSFVPPTKVQSDMLNMLLTQTLPEDVMTMEQRIKVARQEAEDAFWAKIVEHFPEATDGSFLMSDMDDIMLSWVEHWVDNNVPKPAKQPYRGDSLTELTLHYQDTWHLMHTGGGCMVALSDNVVVDGKHIYIGVSSENVCIYIDTFNQDEFMQEHIASWEFGDNPTVLMNIIDTYLGGPVLWNTCKLFDDIMTIGKSKLV